MSSSASTSKTAEKVLEKPKEEDSQPHLGVLEEDDEFEEFEVAGMTPMPFVISIIGYVANHGHVCTRLG
jgi:hypothetical protein